MAIIAKNKYPSENGAERLTNTRENGTDEEAEPIQLIRNALKGDSAKSLESLSPQLQTAKTGKGMRSLTKTMLSLPEKEEEENSAANDNKCLCCQKNYNIEKKD